MMSLDGITLTKEDCSLPCIEDRVSGDSLLGLQSWILHTAWKAGEHLTVMKHQPTQSSWTVTT